MAINKNSNAYIITYTVVMVVIVGALLAFLATSLKDKQYANVLNEKKVSIMKAFGSAEENFDEVVTMGHIVDGEFVEVDKTNAQEVDAIFNQLSDLKGLAEAENNFPIFVYTKDGVTKYVAPMAGKGLWGDIWGYVALQQSEDNVVITGIVMDHAGETPGLGAEIATAKWQEKFQGKELYNAEGEFAVRMQKGGAQNEHQVDAITGGTKTCDGVNAMLANSIKKYESFLLDTEIEAEADVVAEDAAAEGAEQPAEENVEPKTEEE
ncbi:MAG: NADH:ubiquinone reductase (Na(+)-transporting) subunit C [Alistipes sp.]|nr:NADH:ubiquinone reductase (Na(+)-transporting) subunit C [Alistipes sp.]MBO7243305.1 NADH:ubiquinone reductase (Na(+)-transporting) subunit C [Alistipes sp.]